MTQEITNYLQSILDQSPPSPSGPDGLAFLREQTDRMTSMIGSLQTLTFVGSAEDNSSVTATVDYRGALRGIEIDPDAMRDLDHVALAVTCAEAIVSARAKVADELRIMLSDLKLPETGVPAPRIDIGDMSDVLRQAKEAVEQCQARIWNG